MAVQQLLFTDWPRGKGVDPTAAGFQIKACSAGIGPDLRQQLANICMHLGQAFAPSYAPRKAVRQEQDWLVDTHDRLAVPSQILAEFPLLYSYDRLADDLFAIIQARYLGFTHDGRTGNFLAHALVFAPDELASYGNNPLALAHSGLFQDVQLGGDATDLPSLPDLGCPADLPAVCQPLCIKPYSDQLAALCAALGKATPDARPLLLCLDDWRQGAPLLQGLLNLLPPSRRCRTTFSTYESDRNWLPSGKGGRTTVPSAAHSVMVLCGDEGRGFNLRADEYQTSFAGFNFVDNRFSEQAEPGNFAMLAARCVLDGRLDWLAEQHGIIEKLGLAEETSAWDKLAAIANPTDPQATAAMLKETARFAVSSVRQPQQVKPVLDFFLPHLRRLREAGQAESMAALGQELATLADRFDENKAELIHQLLSCLTAADCPDANVRLNLSLLRATRPEGEALVQTLVEMTATGSRTNAAQAIIQELLLIVRQHCSQDSLALAVALGRMAEAAYGTSSAETLLKAYQETLQALPSERERIWEKLAESGAGQVLSHGLLAEILPWDAGESPKQLKKWTSLVSRHHPQALDALCRQLAGQMKEPVGWAERLPLAHELLNCGLRPVGPGFAALYTTLILGFPLRPLEKPWKPAMNIAPIQDLPPAAQGRLRILLFLSQLELRAGRPDWGILQFPHTDPVWEKDVHALDTGQQSQVLEWCIGSFASTTGITTAEEAKQLIGLLAAIGKSAPDEIAKAVAHLLAGRDPVTDVLAAMAFVPPDLSKNVDVKQVGEILAALLERFDTGTRKLFEDHLRHRFWPPSQQKHLESLLQACGLSKPASTPFDGKPVEATRSSEQPSQTGNLFNSIRQGLRNIWGSSETPETSELSKKNASKYKNKGK